TTANNQRYIHTTGLGCATFDLALIAGGYRINHRATHTCHLPILRHVQIALSRLHNELCARNGTLGTVRQTRMHRRMLGNSTAMRVAVLCGKRPTTAPRGHKKSHSWRFASNRLEPSALLHG